MSDPFPVVVCWPSAQLPALAARWSRTSFTSSVSETASARGKDRIDPFESVHPASYAASLFAARAPLRSFSFDGDQSMPTGGRPCLSHQMPIASLISESVHIDLACRCARADDLVGIQSGNRRSRETVLGSIPNSMARSLRIRPWCSTGYSSSSSAKRAAIACARALLEDRDPRLRTGNDSSRSAMAERSDSGDSEILHDGLIRINQAEATWERLRTTTLGLIVSSMLSSSRASSTLAPRGSMTRAGVGGFQRSPLAGTGDTAGPRSSNGSPSRRHRWGHGRGATDELGRGEVAFAASTSVPASARSRRDPSDASGPGTEMP